MTTTPERTTTMTATTQTTRADRLDHLARFEERLWENVPAIAEAEQRAQTHAQATSELNRLLGDHATVNEVVRAAFNTLAGGGSVDPKAFASDLSAAGAIADARAYAHTLTHEATTQPRAEIETLKRAHADDALAVLHETLGDLLTEARTILAELGAVRSPHDAILADKAGTWRHLESAAQILARIRSAQVRLSSGLDGYGQLVRTYGHVRNLADFEPFRHDLRTDPADTSEGETLPDLASQHVAALRWLTRPDVDAWVPTTRALRKAADGMAQAIREAEIARNPKAPGKQRPTHRYVTPVR